MTYEEVEKYCIDRHEGDQMHFIGMLQSKYAFALMKNCKLFVCDKMRSADEILEILTLAEEMI